jgi:hypothetical protein
MSIYSRATEDADSISRLVKNLRSNNVRTVQKLTERLQSYSSWHPDVNIVEHITNALEDYAAEKEESEPNKETIEP